jgi:hypothetical protein
MLKDFILSNCLTKTKNLNNRVCIESWWENRNHSSIYAKIFNTTKYLDVYTPLFSERLFSIINYTENRPNCQVCNKNTCNFKNFKEGYYQYCSKYCSTQSPERNEKIVLNRDYDKILIKTKKTNQLRYGVDFTTQTNNVIKKTKQTKLDRYGSEKYNNIEKANETKLQKYGVDLNLNQTYGTNVRYPKLLDVNWLIEQNKTKSIVEISEGLNCYYKTVKDNYIKNDISINFVKSSSSEQKELLDYIFSIYSGKILNNDRTAIKPKELDIYMPDLNLAIEYNGMYWHSEDKTRHINKYNLCKEKNIQLLQFWDHEWNNKKEIVKSIIASKLNLCDKVYARKCKIVELSSPEYSEFLRNNHLQGSVNSSIRYGLIHNDELVCAIGLGKSRFNKKHTHELLRFANKLNVSVVGGFNKLLKHTLKNHIDIKSLQTFADLRIFTGSVYDKFGFKFSHNSTPGYVYYKGGFVKNRQEFQKHKLKKILPIFNESLSEIINLKNNGWIRVFDCGQVCYVLER